MQSDAKPIHPPPAGPGADGAAPSRKSRVTFFQLGGL